ncbi:DUF4870 domain-containing protein [Nesterenkonia sp. F]|uniref:DUF4870 domain-containing protein n=1 Tax=Nesterenkonia sp. F TaxID=795955 RepID=UPI000255C7D3|nr:DUF4870 domain-containing protein [Nesterenkonia sp. F]
MTQQPPHGPGHDRPTGPDDASGETPGDVPGGGPQDRPAEQTPPQDPPPPHADGTSSPPPQDPPPHGTPPQGPPPQGPPPQGPPPQGPPAGGPDPAGPAPTAAPLSAGEEQGWSIGAHLGGIIAWFIPALVIWLVFRERSRMVADHAKEALNFQITVTIAYVVGWVLTIILIGPLISLAAWVCTIVFGILAAVAANKRQPYRYPVSIRFIS